MKESACDLIWIILAWKESGKQQNFSAYLVSRLRIEPTTSAYLQDFFKLIAYFNMGNGSKTVCSDVNTAIRLH
jgi:hypothetical protein